MTVVVLVVLSLGGLGLLGVVAHRQHERAADLPPVLPEPIEDLTQQASEVGAAAERARRAADEARARVDTAEERRDEAEYRYREAQYGPGPDEPRKLVERAALEAYRRGDLTAAQLDAIWRHVPGETTTGAPEEVVRTAKQRYEHAAAEAARVRQQAYVAGVAAEVLAEEERVAEGELLAAQRSTGAGLPGLFAP
ncbi:hypothetical protein OWR29_09110 [Actinoplanes sp. Pm04-4]|jgi:hypothetical protein|uniref:Secreted protein n=1 Tax=Paractinoplanes pyxinae TaxID=2997416 RepID=A0ABT4AV95_9ACTN|nr:hypothetical protein [Actinoplanes pyxinae]MCY1138154.1 hypothetical protein [Actinoplanes pyxinae]